MKFLVLFLALAIFHATNGQMISSGVPCADVKTIVNLNNEMRGKVAKGTLAGQPKASDMEKIVWDDALARLAQSWANKMVFQHNPNRQDSRFYVGENLFMSSSTGTDGAFNWRQATEAWFNEHTKYTYKPTVSDAATGHYTQVVWANTIYVGCGATYFQGSNGWRNKIYVCNYGPGGNYLGQYPYKTGSGCDNLCCTKNQCGKLYGDKC